MRRTRHGQALVEMAMLFPLLLLIIVGGIIDFGMAFYNMLTLQQLANDAAQYAAESNCGVARSASEVYAYVGTKKPYYWKTSDFPTPTYDPNVQLYLGSSPGKAVQVTLKYNSPVYTPFYQAMMNSIGSGPYIVLGSKAVYQIPTTVYTR